MAEASLLFPIIMITFSLALTGYIYYHNIAHGVQSCSAFFSHVSSRLVQRIDKMAKSRGRWTSNIITGQYADNANLQAGEYELIESQLPDLQHHGLPLAPSDGEHERQFPSGVEAPSITDSSPGSPDSQVRDWLCNEDGGDVDDDLWEILVRSGQQAQSRRSRENHINDHQHRTAVNVMADQDMTPADWEIDADGRRDHAWFHGLVDRVVDQLRAKLEPEVVEVFDSV